MTDELDRTGQIWHYREKDSLYLFVGLDLACLNRDKNGYVEHLIVDLHTGERTSAMEYAWCRWEKVHDVDSDWKRLA